MKRIAVLIALLFASPVYSETVDSIIVYASVEIRSGQPVLSVHAIRVL